MTHSRVLNFRRYVRRPTTEGLVVGAVLLTIAVVIVTLWVRSSRHPINTDQCSKPVSQRVGGWTCPN